MSALVLVIDDDPDFLDPLRDRFVILGIEADYSTTWDEGLDAFRVGQHELVLADYNLPGSEHGLQLLCRVKELNPATRLVLISGKFGADERKDIERVVDRFLEKVADLDEIVREARDAAERSGDVSNWPSMAAAFHDPADPDEESRRAVDDRLRDAAEQAQRE